MEKHPLHLKTPELQKSEEVSNAVEKQERLEEEKLPNDPNVRIEAYMNRLEKIFLNQDQRVRERNLEMLRENMYDVFIIKPEQVPESYFELQQQVARERGQPIEVIPPETRKQMIETAIADQKHSLDQWIDYLTSEDAVYPAWFKYFVWKNITKLSQFDKSLGKFKERTSTTVAPYPDVYREPLAQICDIYEKVAKDNKVLKTDPEVQRQFQASFPKLYAELITKSLSASMEGREEIRGEWIKYEKGKEGDAEKLYQSLEGKGTGWCTAGHSTAEAQISSGDFYVYYTYDKGNNPTQPRIAIRMNGDREIGEVRGTQQHQSLEPQMNDVLGAKLSEFGPEANKYKKKTEDMRKMTEIEKKLEADETLSKPDLEFLYEIDSTIEGFGYQKDPRVEELRKTRNKAEDMKTIFECNKEQIATKPQEVNGSTVAYLGEWNTKVLQTLKPFLNNPNSKLIHLYESFPDKKIFFQTMYTTITSKEDAKEKIQNEGMQVYSYADDLLDKTVFSKESKEYEVVRFSVAQLGLPKNSTTDQIYAKAKELGLHLCTAEVGPNLRLATKSRDYMLIAMEQIIDRDGYPGVFNLSWGDSGLALNGCNADPTEEWSSDDEFVFLSRKP
jgi:hypothetical protein